MEKFYTRPPVIGFQSICFACRTRFGTKPKVEYFARTRYFNWRFTDNGFGRLHLNFDYLPCVCVSCFYSQYFVLYAFKFIQLPVLNHYNFISANENSRWIILKLFVCVVNCYYCLIGVESYIFSISYTNVDYVCALLSTELSS